MSRKIACPVCNETGLMILKKTSTKTAGKVYTYKKWNVYHHTNRKWCYLNKDHLRIPKIRMIIEATQKIAQNNIVATQNTKNCFSRVFHRNNECSLEPGMGIEPMYSGSAAHHLFMPRAVSFLLQHHLNFSLSLSICASSLGA